MLCPLPLASTGRCRCVDDTAVQAERDHAIIAHLPDPSLRVHVRPACFTMSRVATSANATRDANDLVLGERRPLRLPIGLGEDDLHGFEPLLPLGIVATAATAWCGRKVAGERTSPSGPPTAPGT